MVATRLDQLVGIAGLVGGRPGDQHDGLSQGRMRDSKGRDLGDQPGQLTSQQLAGRVVLSTYLDRDGDVVGGELTLRGDEGVVVLLDS